MGEAKRRGTFEERKTQAITAGRLTSIRRDTQRKKTREKQIMRAALMELLIKRLSSS